MLVFAATCLADREADRDLLMNIKDMQGSMVRGAERVMMALQAHMCPAYQAGPLCVCCTSVLNCHACVHADLPVDKGQA